MLRQDSGLLTRPRATSRRTWSQWPTTRKKPWPRRRLRPKPVKRDELAHALQRLKPSSPRTRGACWWKTTSASSESVRHPLTNDDVEIGAVSTASEALAHLRGSTFDCMVIS